MEENGEAYVSHWRYNIMSRNKVRRLCEVVALTMVHDRILYKGARGAVGTKALYTVGAKAR